MTASHGIRSWISAASDRTILRRSIVTCLVVGAILTVINQGDRLLRGEFDAAMGWKIGLTFLVPFVVATISGAAVIRSRGDSNAT
ncbi:MAG: nitrate/nitrite transporter NrtS [Actinomycetota bacterium]